MFSAGSGPKTPMQKFVWAVVFIAFLLWIIWVVVRSLLA